MFVLDEFPLSFSISHSRLSFQSLLSESPPTSKIMSLSSN